MQNIEKFLNKYSFGALLGYLARETKNSKKLQLISLILNIFIISFFILWVMALILCLFIPYIFL